VSKSSLAPLRPLCALLVMLFAAGLASAQTDFVEFESGQVRPLALSPNGSRLFAVNTPDNRLEIFDVVAGSLVYSGSVPVGMEPVAVAARTDTEVWVVNHLSDSVSIVDLAATPPRVIRTLLVGDEPRDILFAGTGGNRAFITTAHRGQYRTYTACSGGTNPGAACTTSATCTGGGTCVNPIASAFVLPAVPDPQLTTEGIGRADVWVFDATSLGSALGGTPVRVLNFFADTPRALATDGTTVYVAAFHSGNQTTTINETAVCNGFQVSGGTNCAPGAPGGVLGPTTNCRQDNADPACEQSVPAPEVGIIVKLKQNPPNPPNPPTFAWRDTGGRDWSSLVHFSLPDHDVFAFNANTLATTNTFDHVGTILFNMAVNPASGRVYVTNTELPNDRRFEGPGTFGGSTVQGHLSETRISVLNPSGATVDPQHLNKHINYSLLHTTAGVNHATIDAQIPPSLATPLQPIVSSNGNTIYMAAFGSAKIGVFSRTAIEDSNFETNFDPTTASASYIPTGGGPSGLVLDETNNRLYVMTRFDNSVRVINPSTKATLQVQALHNPEDATTILAGRPFLYDATISSGNGEASCSSCHIFGDFDSLAWDLGNPDDGTSSNTQPSAVAVLPPNTTFHPMKGPMTTQTLRGLATHGGMHWRGDRVSGFFGTDPCNQNPAITAPCSEDLSFRNFIVAFSGLVGKNGNITSIQMQQFTDFILKVFLPPNPVRPLDNVLTGAAAAGNTRFTTGTTDTVATCEGCHNLNPALGFFGSGGEQSFEGEPQNMKVPHYRNLYTKVGMFGLPTTPDLGEQVRGFGYLHDGSVDTQKHFHEAPVFNLTATEELDLEQFGFAFPTDLAPIVGQQVTLTSTNGNVANSRIDVFETRAGTAFASLMLGGTVTECDVVVKGSFGAAPRGWRRESGTLPVNTIYRNDVNQTITGANLRLLATSQGPLTYTCAPPGSGTRMGIDQDRDLLLDGLDNCAAVSNPGQQNFDGDAQGDVCDPDDDNDGLLDVVETNTGVFVSASNTGSNPFSADSDGDGIGDGTEVLNGWNPNDPLSPGPAQVPTLEFWGRLLLVGGVLALGVHLLRRRGTPTPA